MLKDIKPRFYWKFKNIFLFSCYKIFNNKTEKYNTLLRFTTVKKAKNLLSSFSYTETRIALDLKYSPTIYHKIFPSQKNQRCSNKLINEHHMEPLCMYNDLITDFKFQKLSYSTRYLDLNKPITVETVYPTRYEYTACSVDKELPSSFFTGFILCKIARRYYLYN